MTKPSEESMMMRKKYPGLKIIIDYVAKRAKPVLGIAVLGGGMTFYQSQHARTEIWQETGSHLMDAHNEIWSNKTATANEELEISNLVKRVEQLEKKHE